MTNDFVAKLKDLASQPQVQDTLIGAGLGAGGGLLTNALTGGGNGLRDALIGAGVGGAGGYFGGNKVRELIAKLMESYKGGEAAPETPTGPVAPKRSMNLGTAAAAGALPTLGLGSAIHGYTQGGLGQAAWSGGAGLAGGLAGGVLGHMVGGRNGAFVGSGIGNSLAGTAAAHGFNKSQA